MTVKPLANYSSWERRGDFIFLSGIVAADPQKRSIIKGFDDIPDKVARRIGKTGEYSVDCKDGPILAQSWYILNQIDQIMHEAGGSVNDVFKLVQYFKNLSDFPRYNSVRKIFFANQMPISTVVEVSEMMPSNEILIEVEATAFIS